MRTCLLLGDLPNSLKTVCGCEVRILRFSEGVIIEEFLPLFLHSFRRLRLGSSRGSRVDAAFFVAKTAAGDDVAAVLAVALESQM